MSRYRLTPQAMADLEEIYNYIAEDGGTAMADRVTGELVAAFRRLAAMPSLGRPRAEVKTPRVRFWNANRFLIAFYPDTKPLEILRIIGGRRDLRKLFRTS